MLRLLFRLAKYLLIAVVLYLGVTAWQVWRTGQQYAPVAAGAIVVMGAAQYDGVPSPDLKARLDQAALLWHQHYSSTIVVTGSKEPNDVYTESLAGKSYLERAGIPAADVLQAGGRNSWENLSDAAAVLVPRGDTNVLVVTDKFHVARSMAIASSVGLTPHPTPTQTSPIHGFAAIPYYAKETVGVAVGRIIGFDHLDSIHSFGLGRPAARSTS
jgi:uncharacterized SAM-binding protein YcdF (DUF218 family)